jgi:hypothetical protein
MNPNTNFVDHGGDPTRDDPVVLWLVIVAEGTAPVAAGASTRATDANRREHSTARSLPLHGQ